MDRKLGGLIATLAMAPAFASGDAPYCVHSGSQPSCFYYSVQACQSAARALHGMCAPNSGSKNTPQPIKIDHPNVAESFMRGQQQALDARKTREEIALLAAQRTQLQKLAEATTNDGYWVMYQCQDAAGEWQASGVPAPGCVVEFAVHK